MHHLLRRAAIAGASVAVVACADGPLPTGSSVDLRGPSAATFEAGASSGVLPAPLGRVIVRFRSGSAPGLATATDARQRAAETFAQRHGARVVRAMLVPRAFVFETDPAAADELVASLSSEPDVEWAEHDELVILVPCETGECDLNADSFFGYKWDLHNNGEIRNGSGAFVSNTPRADVDMDWLEAYDALGAAFAGTATVGILDTGIRPTHQDLAGRVVAQRNFATGYAADFVQDRDGHGTHVAGIAAARGNNGVGVSGVAFGANIRIINAKVCERYIFPDGIIRTSCPSSSTADAIMWATDQGANVLNLSLGGSPLATSGFAAQQVAFQYARARNVLPFCATGNDGYHAIAFPARFPECVAVGATNWTDTRATYSNYSAEVELSAPGGAGNVGGTPANPSASFILASTFTADNTYGWKAGTSMATPQAAGLAALLYATGMTNANSVLARMKETADDLGPAGHDNEFGNGRINACRALDPAQLRVEMPGAVSMRDGSNSVIPVTLFGGPRFTVSQFDVAYLTLGDGNGSEAQVALRGDDYRSSVEDIDGDGVLDLVLKFSRDAVGANGDLQPGQRTLVVKGNVGCRRVAGSQSVKVNR
jgi:thermitase